LELLETVEVALFRDCFVALGQVVEGATLEFGDDGLRIQEMDTSHRAEVVWRFAPEACDRYNFQDEPLRVEVAVGDVVRALRKARKSDYALLVDYDGERERLAFTFRGELRRRKSVKAERAAGDATPIPRLLHKAKTKLLLGDLKQVLEDFKGYELVTIHANDSGVTFTSGEEVEEETPLLVGGVSVLEHFVEEESKASYDLGWLFPFVRAAARVGEAATLSFSSDMPLQLDVEIPYGELVFYLAPTIVD